MLGTDGQKMSKSRGNTIELGMDADTTAKVLKRAVTDSDRITYDPENRPEVSNLVLLTALAGGRDPYEVATEIGDGGAATLKKATIEAVNEMLAPIRARRAELTADPAYLLQVLREVRAPSPHAEATNLPPLRRARTVRRARPPRRARVMSASSGLRGDRILRPRGSRFARGRTALFSGTSRAANPPAVSARRPVPGPDLSKDSPCSTCAVAVRSPRPPPSP
ncbi:hypothetical protein [Georgenia sp. SUBG003]|uniref:hypothetical protein n=1 Tax=Georgenia sp. SUBG003 TaxID=1497974 RepID=UPI003AB89934